MTKASGAARKHGSQTVGTFLVAGGSGESLIALQRKLAWSKLGRVEPISG